MLDTYLGYISPDTFQIQLSIHMYPMYSVLLVLGYNGYITIHMWIHVSRYLAKGYDLNTLRIRVSAPWVLMCAKILPKYVVGYTYLRPPCLPPPSSLALSPKSSESLILLVVGVRLALSDPRQRRSLLLPAFVLLVRPLADLRRLVAHVELLQDVVDGEDVRADAHTLEGLARRAVEVGGVALADGNAVLLRRREACGAAA